MGAMRKQLLLLEAIEFMGQKPSCEATAFEWHPFSFALRAD